MGTTQGSNCVLYTADTQQTMLHKLKRHFRRISQRFEEKQCHKYKVNNSTKPTTTTKNELRKKILPPMPRCSSYISLIAIDTKAPSSSSSNKKRKSEKSTPNKDHHHKDAAANDYVQWKIDFEAARPQITRTERTNAMKLPEALAGQITPNGFPAYTIVARAIAATTNVEEQHFNKWRTMSMRNNLQNVAAKSAVDANSLSLNRTFTVRHRLSLRLPLLLFNGSSNKSKYEKQEENKSMKQSSNRSHHSENSVTQQPQPQPQPQSPKFLTKMSKDHANVIEKIYQEIKDLEDYYGTRLDYYYL